MYATRKVKRFRNKDYKIMEEREIMSAFFKYGKLLKQDVVYSRQRGSSVVRNKLYNNMLLSSLMGYHADYERINIETDEKSLMSGSAVKCNVIENAKNDRCLICNAPLESKRNYFNALTKHCTKCNHPSSMTKVGGSGAYYFVEHGIIFKESARVLTGTYEDDWLKIDAVVTERNDTYHNCYCRWTRLHLMKPEIEVFLKIPKYKPVISVNGWSNPIIKNVTSEKKINDVDLKVLGWKQLDFKWGNKPKSVNKIIEEVVNI